MGNLRHERLERCGDCGARPQVIDWSTLITCPDCYDGAPDAGQQNVAHDAAGWTDEQFERLEQRVDRLAKDLWGERAWLYLPGVVEGDTDACAEAMRSRDSGDLVGIEVRLSNEAMALRVLCAALEEAIRCRDEVRS